MCVSKGINESLLGWEGLGEGGLVLQCCYEGLGTREPVVVVYALASVKTNRSNCPENS